jgi:RNA polymerase sigma-70 factor (ECF subfamily)
MKPEMKISCSDPNEHWRRKGRQPKDLQVHLLKPRVKLRRSFIDPARAMSGSARRGKSLNWSKGLQRFPARTGESAAVMAGTADERPAGGVFNTTHWSVVLAAGEEGSEQASAALSRLCQTYWFPVYAFIRKRGHSPDQSQDFTQEFFAVFLEKNYVARAARDRGRFRAFLMSSVENFLHNQHSRAQAQKRGGGQKLLSLDYDEAEERYRIEPVEQSDPATIFEQQWAATLLQAVLNRLRDEFGAEGRVGLFEDLQAHLWGDAESIPYSRLAQKSGLTEGNIKLIAHRMRQRYRELLREEIAQTVAMPGEVDDEIRHLMKIVSQ